MKITLTREKTTPGTVRYRADEKGAAVHTLYIGKAGAAELGDPEKVVITIEAAK